MDLSRRRVARMIVAMGSLAGCADALPGISRPWTSRKDVRSRLALWVGTYSSSAAQGIFPLSYSAAGQWSVEAPVTNLVNASFGAAGKAGRYYLLDEQNDGQVVVCTRDPNGNWTRLGAVSSRGASPCFVSLSDEGNCLSVANYGTGNVVFYRLDSATGLPLEPATIRQNSGGSVNVDRQGGPHAHCVRFASDHSHVYSVDLGTDEVLGYSFRENGAAIGDTFTALKTPAGSGPRHLVFHPDGKRAFVVTELANTLLTLRLRPDARFELVESRSTLPADFGGTSYGGHIALNAAGDRIYVSNRGHNSIAVFAVTDDGPPRLIQIASAHGDWPRFFLLLEDRGQVIVAHQKSGTLAVLKIEADGTLGGLSQRLSVPQPVFIMRQA